MVRRPKKSAPFFESLVRSKTQHESWVGVGAPADFVSFFKRCQAGLTPGGLIFVKENICKSGTTPIAWGYGRFTGVAADRHAADRCDVWTRLCDR